MDRPDEITKRVWKYEMAVVRASRLLDAYEKAKIGTDIEQLKPLYELMMQAQKERALLRDQIRIDLTRGVKDTTLCQEKSED